jgi:hypothetical protein
MASTTLGRGPKIYHLDLTRREIYHLLEYLEKLAVNSPLYDDLKKLVFLLERIKPQLHDQGYFKFVENPEDRLFAPLQTSEGFDLGRH